MSGQRGPLVAAIVAALALGVAIGWWRGAREVDGVGPELAALQARVEQLEAQRAAPALRPGGHGAPMPSRLPGESVVPVTPEQMEAQRAADGERLEQGLAVAFAGQAAAPPGDPVPDRVNAAFADPTVLEAEGLPVSEDVTCRAAMCLVRARFDAATDSTDWVNRMLLAMGGDLPSSSVVTRTAPDGSTELLIYATRPGQRGPLDWAPKPRPR
jgi:hypothetical protein